MQIFLDSANPDELQTAWEWGVIDGVTTNPSLIADQQSSYQDIISKIIGIVDGPISLEVSATDNQNIQAQARTLSSLSRKVVVKIPCTTDGLTAAKALTEQGIKTNITLVFSLAQAVLSAKTGAKYISPFVGRLDDIAEHRGDELLSQIRTTFDEYQFKTKIIAASIRDVAHFEEAVSLGIDAVTVPFHVLEKLTKHKLTDQGLQKFLDDWHRAGLHLPE